MYSEIRQVGVQISNYQFTHHVSEIAITHTVNNLGQMCDKTAIKAQINDVQAFNRGSYSLLNYSEIVAMQYLLKLLKMMARLCYCSSTRSND